MDKSEGRLYVIEGMACQLPSSKEVWRELLELLSFHSGVYLAVFVCRKKMADDKPCPQLQPSLTKVESF